MATVVVVDVDVDVAVVLEKEAQRCHCLKIHAWSSGGVHHYDHGTKSQGPSLMLLLLLLLFFVGSLILAVVS